MKNSKTRLEDVIFENRHKEYGAYELRLNYDKRLVRSLQITIAFALCILAIPLLLPERPHLILPITETEPIIFSCPLIVEPIQIEKPQAQIKTRMVTPPPPSPSTLPDIYKPVNIAHVEPAPIEPVPSVSASESFPAGNSLPGTMTSNTSGPSSSDVITPETLGTAAVDLLPEFPGGMNKFHKYLIDNIKYSRAAKENGYSAKLYISFIVDTDGLITNIKVMNKAEYGMEESVINVLGKSPAWKPGIAKGHPVKTAMTLPVNFVIENR
jgi:periplasmic protein TonB